MYEQSFISTNTLASYAKKITHYGRPSISIRLDDHEDGPFTYTTFDSLSGHVSITAPAPTRFDQVHIMLEGTAQTSVEHMTPVAAQTRSEATHTFLRLNMPIADSEYPQPRVAEAGQTYTFPFRFVIPEHLLPSACTHNCVADHVHEAHLRLPPSMGDFDLSSDDLSPSMAKIAYAIKVRVIRAHEADERAVIVARSSRKIRVMPFVPEAPPLHIPADDREYTLSTSKSLRKGMFKGKLGRLTASAAQTKALLVSPTSSSPPTIVATVCLRFDPADSAAAPPRLGSLSSKIKSHTFYGVRALSHLATRMSMFSSYNILRGVYTTSIPLPTRCVANATWSHHPGKPPQYLRRDSGYSTASENGNSNAPSPSPYTSASGPQRRRRHHRPEPESGLGNNNGAAMGGSGGDGGASYYETNIILPLAPPRNKTWLPTFHACLVSRVYLLDISLTVHSPGAGVPSTTFSLHLPLQISTSAADAGAHGGADAGPGLGVAEDGVGVEEYLVPRVLGVPREEFVHGSAGILDGSRDRLGSVGSATSAVEGGAEDGAGAGGDDEQPPDYEIVGSGRMSVRQALAGSRQFELPRR